MKSLLTRIEEIEQKILLSDKRAAVFAVFADGSEKYLYAYPDTVSRKIRIHVGDNPDTTTYINETYGQ